jgi:uncharacterized lipoprotein YddW (UPF0748 family)
MGQALMNYIAVVIMILLLPLHAGQEKRAIWVVRDALESSESIDEIISTAVSAKITDLFVQVRALGQTYYHSSIEDRASGITDSYDPLWLVIEKAHRYQIHVHAWINVLYVWAQDNEPDSSHIYIIQKNYILRNRTFPTYATLRKKGLEGFYLDPSNAQVQNHILSIVEELIDNYNLDGIHFDYFRYPGIDYSFTPESRTEFRIRNYFDPYMLYYSDFYQTRAGFSVFRHADSLYRSYLIKNLTLFLDRAARFVRGKKESVEISVAVKPDPIQAKHRFFQDWTDWLQRGICDFVVIMNYRTNWQDFVNILTVIKEYTVDKKVMVGISTYNQNEMAVRKRILYVQAGQFYGFSLFSYNHIVKNKSYLYKLML